MLYICVTIQYFMLTFYVKFLKLFWIVLVYMLYKYFYDLFHILLSSD
jgi:hypothetical protein